jgi:hypothetical protein
MDIHELFEMAGEWTEKHPGLAAWIAIAVAIGAAAVSWYALRFEAERTKNVEFNAQIDRLLQIVSKFNTDLQTYTDAVKRGEEYFEPIDKRAITQLSEMKVTEWPSVDSFNSFHGYWEWATAALEANIKDKTSFERMTFLHKFRYGHLEFSLIIARKSTKSLIDELMS